MKSMFSNATVMWNQREIARRETLVKEIPLLLYETWQDMNRAIRMERVETPVLVPGEIIKSHVDTNFALLKTDRGYLRPETTAGTYAAFLDKYPQAPQMASNLPFCMWQVGLSFRDEQKPDTMRATRLRLVQFYQMEFQLFHAATTKADYLTAAANALVQEYGGILIEAAELPHYSEKTIDWFISDLEVAGCSVRLDWPFGKVTEIAIGIDRLVALQMNSTG